ncbi:capsular polysaccharide export protein, LipB/KpsS family [Pseudomonas segetis]
MKIITVGFYDDFSRFFLRLNKEICDLCPGGSYLHLALNFSGYVYWRLRDSNVKLLPWLNWFFSNNKRYSRNKYNEEVYKGVNLDWCVAYHLGENNLSDKQQSKYYRLAMSYVDQIDALLKRERPDLVLLSGDSRLAVRVMISLCHIQKISTRYFEQGPFASTILDHLGVNANASIRHDWDTKEDVRESEDLDLINQYISRPKHDRYKRNLVYRFLDMILNTYPMRYVVPCDIQERGVGVFIINKLSRLFCLTDPVKQKCSSVQDVSCSYTVLLVLQVPQDANMLLHSPLYDNHADIVEDCIRALPQQSKLVVREHPLYKGCYEPRVYELINKHSCVCLDDNRDVIKSVDGADVIVVNNSMLGVEALLSFKPILALGDSYYDRVVTKVILKKDLAQSLINAIHEPVDRHSRIAFMKKLCFSFLQAGHYRYENLDFTRDIAKKLISGLIR